MNKPDNQKCEEIAKMCNERGISKEQLSDLIKMLGGK